MSLLYKKILNKLKYNSSRKYLEKVLKQISNELEPNSLLLDAGAGDGRYKKYFPNVIYESADICKLERDYGNINYVCSLTDIPVEDNRFDTIICTQVLEHINEPGKTLIELSRVLKPNGKILLTAPLYYPEHEIPYDFYRYTQFGFKYLFEKANFGHIQIEWLEGYYMTISNQLWIAAKELKLFDKNLGIWNIFTLPLFAFLKLLFPIAANILGRIDLISKVTNRGHCKNYVVRATKNLN